MTIELNNNHNVYILGAGFSAPAGLPVVANFMATMRDAHEWLVGNGRTKEADAVERVLAFRMSAASAAYRVQLDLENVEELFSLASSSGGLADEMRLAIAATLAFRRATSRQSSISFDYSRTRSKPWKAAGNIGQDPERYTTPFYEYAVYALLGGFAGHPQQGTNAFISFNYDTLVEEALMGLQRKFDYGISASNTLYDPSIADHIGADAGSVRLLKLHGSVNWAAPKVAGEKLRVFLSYDELIAAKRVPELVPPTWQKLFAAQLADVWRSAVEEIRKATRIIIIGFSIPPTDLHFKYLLAAGLQSNLSLRQIVGVNSDPSRMNERLRSLLSDVSRQDSTLSILGNKLEDLVGTSSDYMAPIGRTTRGAGVAVQNLVLGR